jgi:ribonuclease P protein component
MRDHSETTLRRQRDFSRVYNRGKSRGSKYVVVLYRENRLGYTRTAFVASKKVGNSVERNRARRLMREAYRSFADQVASGYDIVYVARNTIAGKKEDEVEKNMKTAMNACGLFDKH